MIQPAKLLRESLLLLFLATAVAVGFQGYFFGFSLLLAGLLAVANFFLLGRLVTRVLSQSPGRLMAVILFSMKFFVVTGALLVMLMRLDPPAVLVGFGVVLVTTTVRGTLGALAPETLGSES
jgi:hypothetical protein